MNPPIQVVRDSRRLASGAPLAVTSADLRSCPTNACFRSGKMLGLPLALCGAAERSASGLHVPARDMGCENTVFIARRFGTDQILLMRACSLAAPAISVESETAGIDARALIMRRRLLVTTPFTRARRRRAAGEERQRRPSTLRASVADIVVQIDGVDVDVTSYAREHPGGAAVLRKFHGKDASRAFHAAKHSKAALDRMRRSSPRRRRSRSRARQALHARGPVAGAQGARALVPGPLRRPHPPRDLVSGPDGRATGLSAVPWLVPHALLSLSSIKFHVPRERIAKKPMIWQEFRMHNIIFALRSFVCAALAAASLHASTITRRARRSARLQRSSRH